MGRIQDIRERRRAARQRQQRRQTAAYVLLVVLVLGLAGVLIFKAFTGPALPAVSENVIDVAIDMAGYDKSEIRVKANEEVTIRLTSLDTQFHTDGGGKHQLAVDELELDIIAQPKSSSVATFTPTQPGTYTFYCDICCGGRANPTMQGTLIVEA